MNIKRREQLTTYDLRLITTWTRIAENMKEKAFGISTGRITVRGVDGIVLGVIDDVNGEITFRKA